MCFAVFAVSLEFMRLTHVRGEPVLKKKANHFSWCIFHYEVDCAVQIHGPQDMAAEVAAAAAAMDAAAAAVDNACLLYTSPSPRDS